MDHNKLWKILKEMGIPDRLTCLLRNLYAGQEATVRMGRGGLESQGVPLQKVPPPSGPGRNCVPHLHEDKAGDDGKTPLQLRSPSRHGDGWACGDAEGMGPPGAGPRGSLRSSVLGVFWPHPGPHPWSFQLHLAPPSKPGSSNYSQGAPALPR